MPPSTLSVCIADRRKHQLTAEQSHVLHHIKAKQSTQSFDYQNTVIFQEKILCARVSRCTNIHYYMSIHILLNAPSLGNLTMVSRGIRAITRAFLKSALRPFAYLNNAQLLLISFYEWCTDLLNNKWYLFFVCNEMMNEDRQIYGNTSFRSTFLENVSIYLLI